MTDEDWDGSGQNRSVGYIYDVVGTWEEAIEIKSEIEGSFDKVSILEGFDDTPQIGGLSRC